MACTKSNKACWLTQYTATPPIISSSANRPLKMRLASKTRRMFFAVSSVSRRMECLASFDNIAGSSFTSAGIVVTTINNKQCCLFAWLSAIPRWARRGIKDVKQTNQGSRQRLEVFEGEGADDLLVFEHRPTPRFAD